MTPMGRFRSFLFAAALGGFSACSEPCSTEAPPAPLFLRARHRIEMPPGSGRSEPVTEVLRWEAARTAVIVCDMWDADWCRDATRRMDRLVPRVDAFVRAARQKGAVIIHAPSGTMTFYEDTPQRRRTLEAARIVPPEPIATRRFDPSREGPWPIDDSRSICADNPPCVLPKKQAHTRQHEGIEIAGEDAITDSGSEVYNLLAARGIRQILFTGVHNNLCCLVRSFGIRQLRRLGFQVVLVRDLTLAMVDPRKRPFVSVEQATELVNEHIERYWCPTISSLDLEERPE